MPIQVSPHDTTRAESTRAEDPVQENSCPGNDDVECSYWTDKHGGTLGGIGSHGCRAEAGLNRTLAAPCAAVLVCLLLAPTNARAQYVPNYFSPGVPGYGEQMGVTVVTRVRPLYEQPGVRFGDWIIHPNLDESTGYNSNVLGLQGGPSSWVVETNPSLQINSDWSRDSLGAAFSADNLQYPGSPNQDETNWQAAIGGGYTIGRSDLQLAYAHLALHELPTDIGAPPSSTPLPYSVDDVRSDYTFDFGRLKITPNLEYQHWQFGSTTISGVTSDQAFRNRGVYQAGSAFRYELSGTTSLLLVTQAVSSQFVKQQPGLPSLSSNGGLVLTGIDYQYTGPWRYQLLVGAAVRSFTASQFKTQASPIAQATVIWTPTGLTTVTGSVLRTIEDPTVEATSGFNYTTAQLRVDHEYLRNVLLDVEGGVENADYFQGGTQTVYYGGGGATWLLNRWLRLSAHYQFTRGQGTQSTTTATVLTSSPYSQNLILFGLHVGL